MVPVSSVHGGVTHSLRIDTFLRPCSCAASGCCARLSSTPTVSKTARCTSGAALPSSSSSSCSVPRESSVLFLFSWLFRDLLYSQRRRRHNSLMHFERNIRCCQRTQGVVLDPSVFLTLLSQARSVIRKEPKPQRACFLPRAWPRFRLVSK